MRMKNHNQGSLATCHHAKIIALAGLIISCASLPTLAGDDAGKKKFRGLIGPNSKKVKVENGKTMLYGGMRGSDPTAPGGFWYDFTGSVIPAAELQFGIGKDAIPSIDDPMFVSPDDPRLLKNVPPSPYRKDQRPSVNDEIHVIGFTEGSVARAYPVALLDRHELVNDTISGKPVTVGW